MSFPLPPLQTEIHVVSLQGFVSSPQLMKFLRQLHKQFAEMGGPRLAGGEPSYPSPNSMHSLASVPGVPTSFGSVTFVIQTAFFRACRLRLAVVVDTEVCCCCCVAHGCSFWKASQSLPEVLSNRPSYWGITMFPSHALKKTISPCFFS